MTEPRPPSIAIAPSTWVKRFAPLIPAGGPALDLACGGGRHTRLLLGCGHPVVAIDRDLSGLADLDDPNLKAIETDLESGAPWPWPKHAFAGVVVTNYLHRPLLTPLLSAVQPDGVLIYETFAQGNERFGRPSNPAFLLAPGELLDLVRGKLHVLAYEDLTVDDPKPARIQRICATGLKP